MLYVIPTSDHPAVTFACEELARHWPMLGDAWQGPDPVLRVGPGLEGLRDRRRGHGQQPPQRAHRGLPPAA